VTFSQVGANVVASGAGSIDTKGLTSHGNADLTPFVEPFPAAEATGSPVVATTEFYGYLPGPPYFGFGGETFATTGAGAIVSIRVISSIETGFIGFPAAMFSARP